jgi:phospholipid-binding lipoprotein MlaA
MNSLLQFKIVKSLNTVARIAVNSTVGLGGLIDVATIDGIKRENEDFGQTLGFYGVGPGPYLVLPLLGPSGLRDTAGLVTDSVVYSLMMSQLIAELGMDDTNETILNYSLTGLYVIDKRHSQSFRYFMTGSPFEYDLVRRLHLLQREFLIDN